MQKIENRRAEMSDIRMIAFGSRGNELLRFR
jgi:hypothetical protein